MAALAEAEELPCTGCPRACLPAWVGVRTSAAAAGCQSQTLANLSERSTSSFAVCLRYLISCVVLPGALLNLST